MRGQGSNRVERQVLNPDGLMQAYGWSHVITVKGTGTTVYCAGQVAVDENGDTVGVGDFQAQVTQAYKNLEVALEAAGATPNDLVKTTNFVVNLDPSMIPALRDGRNAAVSWDAPPASSLIGVAALAREGLLIEVEGVAVID